ncbi:MAG TPA: hypothetical protein VGW12_13900 [Pyrinomonadaceae bacterium]|nr:hypothetical protein [Pyrinomonadaceae bacterium]
MLKRVVTRRLPGFRFEAQAPALDEWLPRMDVAAFVGFAASGPLNLPVAVESVAQFTAIFGEDAQVAWDRQRSVEIFAYLAPAVRSFFDNGGRRCWIIRVARTESAGENARNRARANFFPVPGLMAAALDADGSTTGAVSRLNPAYVQARSEGSWSDDVTVSASLISRPAQVISFSLAQMRVELALDSPDDLVAGDLLRLTFRDEYALLFQATNITPLAASSPTTRRTVQADAAHAVWLRSTSPHDPPLSPKLVDVRTYTSEPQTPIIYDSQEPFERTQADEFAVRRAAILYPWDEAAEPSSEGREIRLDVAVSAADAPAPGSLMRVEGQNLWVTVEEIGVTTNAALAGAQEVVQIKGRGFWWLESAPGANALEVNGKISPEGERLAFELWARKGSDYALTLGELAFGASHPRYFGQLPTDREAYEPDRTAPVNEPAEQLWQPVGEVRFPLAAGEGAESVVYFPLGMQFLPEAFLTAVKLPGTPLERDGLAEFDADLFLDPDLKEASLNDLLSRADFIRYLSDEPRRLRGVHAALSLEEVTIVSVPDAVHRSWERASLEKAPSARRSAPFPRPEWWHFLDCDRHDDPPLVRRPPVGNFLNCDIEVIERPLLASPGDFSESGTYTLTWASTLNGATFVLEESSERDWSAGAIVYTGKDKRYTLYGRRPGDYYYRVRAVTAKGTSDWSNGVSVRVAPSNAWQLTEEVDYANTELLSVQRALVRMCAARGDLLAVLSLPVHYREDKAIEHISLLKTTQQRAPGADNSVRLNNDETGAFSYAAIYHPWLTARDSRRFDLFRDTPPDGAACGILARRANARGAWVAPANELLRGAVALTPAIVRHRWLDLQLAQLNLIRQEPRGFLALNADTLSDDEDLRLINVRRLLILLRRLALRHGATYVFEPNSAAFRRLVQRGFEALLDRMFLRGAFAGRTAAASYQVVTSESLNTRQSVEQGRFIVELRVAPSLPMTFMTIRLVQTGDRGFVTEAR